MAPLRPGPRPIPFAPPPPSPLKRTRTWLVSVPVWGDRFRDIFASVGLPMLRHAADVLGEHVRLIVHTDLPELMHRQAVGSMHLETYPVPAGQQWFHSMSRAHRDTIASAQPGDAVVILTADMTMSENALAACRTRFDQGKRLVCVNATRTNDEKMLPYRPTSRALSEWAWANRHPMVRDCTWPDGRAPDLCRVYFEKDESAVCRLWLAHPLALMFDGRRTDFGPTVDCNMVTNYQPNEVHVVTDPDELCAIELSPPSKLQGSRDADEPPEATGMPPMSERYRLLHKISPEVYRHVLSQRIVIAGSGDGCGDDEAVKSLLT